MHTQDNWPGQVTPGERRRQPIVVNANAMHMLMHLHEVGVSGIVVDSELAEASMKFGILGHLEITSSDGAPVYIAQPRVRALVSVLLLRAGRACSRRVLIDALWESGRLPEHPDAALRMYAYRARAALGPGPDRERLVTLADAYRIDPRDGELDLHLFRDFCAEGEQALAAGDPGKAKERLSDALGCWKDPPLADLPVAPGIEGEVARLLEQRHAAEVALADAELALGHYREILPYLRQAVVEDPLSERSWAQLIQALYRSRGRGPALAAFGKARGVLLRELGVEPGQELQILLQGVLRGSPDLELGPAVTPASAIQPVHARVGGTRS